ncbi:hypothetical protein HK100_008356, partial [Physocladia obscura]
MQFIRTLLNEDESAQFPAFSQRQQQWSDAPQHQQWQQQRENPRAGRSYQQKIKPWYAEDSAEDESFGGGNRRS